MYIPLFSRFPLVRKDVYVPYVLIAASLDLFSALSTAASPHYNTTQCNVTARGKLDDSKNESEDLGSLSVTY
jgi:hypothetical protein